MVKFNMDGTKNNKANLSFRGDLLHNEHGQRIEGFIVALRKTSVLDCFIDESGADVDRE